MYLSPSPTLDIIISFLTFCYSQWYVWFFVGLEEAFAKIDAVIVALAKTGRIGKEKE